VLHENLTSRLSDLALSLRVSYVTGMKKAPAQILAKSFDIPAMISEAVQDEKKARLATLLFNSLSIGEEEQALKIAANFYGDIR